MKKSLSSFLLLFTWLLTNCASVKFSEDVDGKFEVQDMTEQCIRTGSRDTGVQCLRVAANNSTRDKAFGLAKKYAVAAVLLRGVSGTNSPTKNPLLSQEEQQQHTRWISEFFNQGEYLKYLEQAEIEPNEVYTIKGGYRVGINARVDYERLNQRLFDDEVKKKVRF